MIFTRISTNHTLVGQSTCLIIIQGDHSKKYKSLNFESRDLFNNATSILLNHLRNHVTCKISITWQRKKVSYRYLQCSSACDFFYICDHSLNHP